MKRTPAAVKTAVDATANDRGNEAGASRAARGLKILEITSYPPPRAGWGVRVSFLRRHVLEQGGHCVILNIGKSRRIPSPEYLDVQGGWDYLRKVVRHARRGFLIHTHINGDGNKGWGLALVAEIAAKLWGCPCVLSFHAGPRQRYFPRDRSGIWLVFYKLIFGLAQRVVCNSEAVKAGIEQFGVPPAKIHPIQAFSRQYLDYETTALDPELDRFLAEHRPVALVYFFLRPEFFIDSLLKGIRALIAKIPTFGVVAVGMETQTPDFRRMLSRAGVESNVFAAGDLEHDRFLTILSRSSFYLRTPSKDGVSSSVLESLSLGVPVIASENGHRPESVITFTPDDAASLVEAVERCWREYDAVCGRVVRPEIPDTVATEIRLLSDAARERQARSTSRTAAGER